MRKFVYGLIIFTVFILAVVFGRNYIVYPGTISGVSSFDAVDGALTPFKNFTRGEVLSVVSEEQQEIGDDMVQRTQSLEVELRSGPDAGKKVQVLHQEIPNDFDVSKIRAGDELLLGYVDTEDEQEYVVVDRYRLPGLIAFVGVFFALVLFFARWRGFTSLVGLCFSLAVIVFFMAPNIALGRNPLLIAFISALCIILVSTFLAHGLRVRTLLSVLSMIITLGIAQGLAVLAVYALHLFGTGSQDATYLQAVLYGMVDLRGVLLAGIVVGTLGVLDDVATTQTASVEEIHKANRALNIRELYARGASVGREHVAALVNTLVLAYASVALPVILLLTLHSGQPFWVIINSEAMVEEIVRTLVGSIAIVLAVPISTFLAAYVFGRNVKEQVEVIVREEVIVAQEIKS